MTPQRSEKYIAIIEDADIIAISEAGFLEGCQLDLEGFEIIANQGLDNETNYWNMGVAVWLRKGSEMKVMNYVKVQLERFQTIQVLLKCGLTIIAFYQSPNQEPPSIRKTAKIVFRETPEEAVIVGNLNFPKVD